MKKLHQLKCTNCGANLEIDPDREIIVCSYCGVKLLLEDTERPSVATRLLGREILQPIEEWLKSIGVDVSLDFFPPPLQLAGLKVTDDDLPRLLPLENLVFLDVGRTAVTDRGMAVIGKFKNLKYLYLNEDEVGDGGIALLEALAQLRCIRLDCTRITDRSLPILAGLPLLNDISLEGTEVTAAGLVPFLPKAGKILLHCGKSNVSDAAILRSKVARLFPDNAVLNLSGQKLVDADLSEMLYMKKLENLSLTGNRITDEGLKTVGQLTFLANLWLDQNPVTDAGLEHLGNLKRLKTIYLSGTGVTGNGIKKLQRLLPDVKI